MTKEKMSTVGTFSPNNGLVEERRRQIIQAALRLLSTKGTQKTGIREIARASNMTIGNLYHYVGTREDIIYLAINHGISQVRELIKDIAGQCESLEPREALRVAIDRYIRYQNQNWEGTVFIYQEMGSMTPALRLPVLEINSEMHDLFAGIIHRGYKDGSFGAADTALVTATIVSMGDMWSLKRWYFKKTFSLDKFIDAFTGMILKVLGAE
jgi:AcrR family transcriptional regulator